jgi:hypothetical protein
MAKSDTLDNRFSYFPQFRNDYPVLESTGIIKPADDHYEWTNSKTSLGQYFNWLKGNDKYRRIRYGSWHPVETAFWIKGKPIKNRQYRQFTNNKSYISLEENISSII